MNILMVFREQILATILQGAFSGMTAEPPINRYYFVQSFLYIYVISEANAGDSFMQITVENCAISGE